MNGPPHRNRRSNTQTAQVLSGDIHVNDVLFGRGINLAGLAGNERLRALAKARRDSDYCEQFSSSEKRALAVEIVQHIQSLDPPGRFLKRPKGFETTRNYQGHWEVLSEKDAIKKATQTLRDCNRSDRRGYANEVEAPDDVVEFANRLTHSGLTLRKYAEALVAQSGRSPTASPYVLDGQTFANPPPVHSPAFARGHSPPAARVPPNEDQPPVQHWQEAPPPPMVHAASAVQAAPSPSAFPGQETPAPYKAPVPVSTTPPSPNHNHAHPDLTSEYNQHDHFAENATSPILQSPSNFVNETDNDPAHPYSPSALDFDAHRSLETDSQLDAYTSQHHTNEIEDHTPRPFSLTDDDELAGPQPQDVLQRAAAAFGDHRVDHRRTNSLTLMAGDDAFFNH
eukprot:Nitzschia sp. Nitz4//scaffold68_size99682//31503//32690//NITZ4_004559-RA/size99682-processed-gene-0.17-mRNA-1//1//CDS//3329556578//6835//frame0